MPRLRNVTKGTTWTTGVVLAGTSLPFLLLFVASGENNLELPVIACSLFSAIVLSAHYYFLKKENCQLRESYDRLQMVAEVANIGIWELDIADSSLTWNDSMYRIYGIDKESFGGTYEALLAGIHPEDKIRVEEECTKAARGESPHYETNFRVLRPDGSIRQVKAYGLTQFDDAGNALRQVGVNWDITIWDAKQQLKDRDERVKLATAAANIHIWELDIISDTLKWGDMLHGIFDPPKGTFSRITEAWINTLHPDDKTRILDEADKAMRGELPRFDLTYRVLRPDGTVHHIREYGTMQFDCSGRPVRMLGASWDVTKQKETELQLIKRTQELEAATKAKSQFLANMSHEIRTPLTSIIGYCETLHDKDLSPSEQREAAGAVFSSARHLLSIVNNVLDMSRLEAGKTDIYMGRVCLFELMDDIVTIERKKLADKQLHFDVEYCYPLPRFFYTDLTALKQILFNISDNAIKFTDSGEIKIRVSFEGRRNLLSFAISDTGIGVTPEQCSRLFQAFSQGDPQTTRRFGGSGLGLAISKHLAFLLGGNISVESSPGKGSVFTVNIPAGAVTEKSLVYAWQSAAISSSFSSTSPVTELPQMAGRVLLVEDSIEIQKYIEFLLRKMGLMTTVVGDGEKALSATKSREFDLILMDMHLPDMDGQSATRLIRSSGIRTPILALTADARKDNVERCFQVGCSDFLAKPFSRAGLIEKLTALLKPAMKLEVSVSTDISHSDYAASMREFIDSFSIRIEELERAHLSREFDSLSKKTHRLAGAAAFAYPAVYEPLLGLNDASREQNAESCSRSLAQLKEIHEMKGNR